MFLKKRIVIQNHTKVTAKTPQFYLFKVLKFSIFGFLSLANQHHPILNDAPKRMPNVSCQPIILCRHEPKKKIHILLLNRISQKPCDHRNNLQTR